jgi:hypothetical protein
LLGWKVRFIVLSWALRVQTRQIEARR